jgi:hypothetical protein
MNEALIYAVKTKLAATAAITQLVKNAIHIVSDPNIVPPGTLWPYIAIKDGGIEPLDSFGGQVEEMLKVHIYICHRSHAAQPAGQLYGVNAIAPISEAIKTALRADFNTQFALSGFYTDSVPIQLKAVTDIRDNDESETFTPKGETGATDRITSRLRIDAAYYRYSIAA